MRCLPLVLFVCCSASASGQATPVRFGRDVLPILSANCFSCHGPDESHRQADLRLDTRDGALAAIDLAEPLSSELLRRIQSPDADEVMPPPSSKKNPLTRNEVEILKSWIAEGAPWGQHWSLEPPVKVDLPADAPHPIDAFVQKRLKAAGLEPAQPAPGHTLLRRLTFDLTGLPPTPDQIRDFLGKTDTAESPAELAEGTEPGPTWEQSIEAMVDQLLNSPHFGERMAMWWLDAARYADTDGFQGDDTRTNWPWRDWVVQSFNDNLPFDQFTIQQFAGDLLPNATPDQQLATCFHRNHMTNGEGGRDPEESRIDYVIDRVNSLGTVWLGLTLGCCQCHSHKYDPISHAEFYSLAAFFDSIDEDGRASKNAKPYLAYESRFAARAVEETQAIVAQRRPREQAARQAASEPFRSWFDTQQATVSRGFQAWQPLRSTLLEAVEGTTLQQGDDYRIIAGGPNPVQDDYRIAGPVELARVTGLKLEIHPLAETSEGGYSRGASGEFILTDIKIQVRRPDSSQVRDVLVAGAVADVSAEQKGPRSYGDIAGVLDDDPRNGWTTLGHSREQIHTAVFALDEPLVLEPAEELLIDLKQRSTTGDANIGCFRILVTDQAGPAVKTVGPGPLEKLAVLGDQKFENLDDSLRNDLFDQFLADYAPYQVERQALQRAQRQLQEVEAAAKAVNVMVLAERAEPRTTHVLIRGVWDKKGDVVSPNVPAALTPWLEPFDPKVTPSRLDLAHWIVDRRNPLTARVIVNHFWQMLFGTGLVRTADDFGLQGERPTHPELLDWLAVDFMEHNWDVKYLVKLIVTSKTYQQSSVVTDQLLAIDPENRLLARGARYRLPSWMLRDAALTASGLLNPAIGGPPVKPYQPDGVWEEMFMGRFTYEPSEGPAQYRRTLYAFWRRAIAPTFLFDSAQRRVCEVRIPRTNTPLQALTLLNDQNFLVASRALAQKAIGSGDSPPEQIRFMVERILSRPPAPSEMIVLTREYVRALKHYRTQPEDAVTLVQQMDSGLDEPESPQHSSAADDPAELAAATLAASLVFNLDEAITHE